jgi:sporulation protein YlmC with PRC-barrel domain
MVDETELRSLAGHEVIDCDGKSVGYVDQIFNDNETGKPEWIGVTTGTIRRRFHLVPVAEAENANGTLRVPWTKERVNDAPEYGRGDVRGILGLGDYRPGVSEAKEREAYIYFGLTDGQ